MLVGNSSINTNNDGEIQVSVSIYPNPTTDFINILSTKSIEFMELIDISGKVMGTFHLAINPIDISKLDGGVYFLKISIAGQTEVFKIRKI